MKPLCTSTICPKYLALFLFLYPRRILSTDGNRKRREIQRKKKGVDRQWSSVAVSLSLSLVAAYYRNPPYWPTMTDILPLSTSRSWFRVDLFYRWSSASFWLLVTRCQPVVCFLPAMFSNRTRRAAALQLAQAACSTLFQKSSKRIISIIDLVIQLDLQSPPARSLRGFIRYDASSKCL